MKKKSILFDSIDLEILHILKTTKKSLGIMELSKKVGIAHKNFRPHLLKLQRYWFIDLTIVPGGRKINVVLREKGEQILSMFLTKQQNIKTK